MLGIVLFLIAAFVVIRFWNSFFRHIFWWLVIIGLVAGIIWAIVEFGFVTVFWVCVGLVVAGLFADIPIVMVTAKIEEIDRLLGLEIGADDYICKPYSPREVVARVKTILRRCKPQRELQQQDAESPLIIDEGRFQASWRGKMLDLTPAEFRLLKTLSHEPGKVFSREQLLNHLYDDYRVVTDRTIDSHIKNLRRKLESLDAEQSFIRAVYGVGYRWEADACRIV